jgi:hypothetical protein
MLLDQVGYHGAYFADQSLSAERRQNLWPATPPGSDIAVNPASSAEQRATIIESSITG